MRSIIAQVRQALLPNDDRFGRVDPVNLENVLGDIQSWPA